MLACGSPQHTGFFQLGCTVESPQELGEAPELSLHPRLVRAGALGWVPDSITSGSSGLIPVSKQGSVHRSQWSLGESQDTPISNSLRRKQPKAELEAHAQAQGSGPRLVREDLARGNE